MTAAIQTEAAALAASKGYAASRITKINLTDAGDLASIEAWRRRGRLRNLCYQLRDLIMPSVTKDKKKYGAPTIGGDTSENRKRKAKEREEARAEEMRMDNEARMHGNEFYYTGWVRPLIDEE